MDKSRTATFIGHKECYRLDYLDVKRKIAKLIDRGFSTFLNGGMGTFDWMCGKAVFELKKDYPHIKNYLVIPYLTFNILNKEHFDEIIYPEGFEKYHFKAAIPARNRYMIDKSSAALCYVNHGWGGAAQTFTRAIKKGLEIINLGDMNYG